jgi:hypothetical protein
MSEVATIGRLEARVKQLERQRDGLAAALRVGGTEYGDVQAILGQIADYLEKMGINGWPNLLRWKVEAEQAALESLDKSA